jgi:hypothetical protein
MEDVIAQVKGDRLDQAKLTQLMERHQAEQKRVMQRCVAEGGGLARDPPTGAEGGSRGAHPQVDGPVWRVAKKR